ncbi:MAG: selenocysteine-specific translation elongation factor [Sulfuricella sp.]|nr:selenocysteine-specific translation elongation factor [Sulfuricella sp.]
MIIGTAGHIDHGKTALVKALTGVDADRLKEEKARGITVDLGYAYAPLPGGGALGFIDVPGHEKLVHNMLAGATGIDFALLAVAADDGPMPQTREHLQILGLLGLARGAVALTKTDRVSAWRLDEAQAEIRALLHATPFASSPIFPLSSVSGAGLGALQAHLAEAAAGLPARIAAGNFRLAVDRCFTLAGTGTVVTGTVFSGEVRVGDRLLLSPSGIPVRVRGIHAQNRPAERGFAGQRCALNLAGAQLEKSAIRRGDWVVAPAAHAPAQRLDVRLKLLDAAPAPLRHWTPLHLHLGAADVMARVVLLQGETLEPGGEALAQLVLDRPVGALRGDRFIVRDQGAKRTVGGGMVLDAQAPARKRRTPQRFAMLAALEQLGPEASLSAALDGAPEGVDLASFALNWNLTREEAEALWRDAPMATAGRTCFVPARWDALRRRVRETLAAEHRASPDTLGPDAGRLRRMAAPELAPATFGAVMGRLLEEKEIARTGSRLHLPGHRLTLAPADRALWQRASPLLSEQPFQPPRVRDLARALNIDEQRMRLLMQRLAAMGEVVAVAHDHYFMPQAVQALEAEARRLAREEQGAIAAAPFRDRIGTGRKLAIQILEFLDRSGVTRRTGEVHRLRENSSAIFIP